MTNQGTRLIEREQPQVSDTSIEKLINEIGLTFWALPYSFGTKVYSRA